MLYPIYEAIKTKLATLELPVEWYNVQYEETMHNTEGIFIEFPEPMPFTGDSKEMLRAPLKIRVHVYSQVVRTSDGIADAAVQAHEAKASAAMALLRNWIPDVEGVSVLRFSDWQHWHRWKGWMVTFVDFTSKKSI